MKRGLFIALTGIAVLLWVEQGLAVSYGWKTLAKIVLFLAVPLLSSVEKCGGSWLSGKPFPGGSGLPSGRERA